LVFDDGATVTLHPNVLKPLMPIFLPPVWTVLRKLEASSDDAKSFSDLELELAELLRHPQQGMNMKNETGETVLHVAIKAGSLTSIRAIAGTDFQAFLEKDDSGNTAYDLAAKFRWRLAQRALEECWPSLRGPFKETGLVSQKLPTVGVRRAGLQNQAP
jgi:hypothetical protein